jgi:hypothetical protein
MKEGSNIPFFFKFVNMLKKEFIGHEIQLKHFKVLVCEENIEMLKKLGVTEVFEEKKKAKK